VQRRLADSAGKRDLVAVGDAPHFGVVGWISSRSSGCQAMLAVRRVCAPTLYWLKIRPVVRISG